MNKHDIEELQSFLQGEYIGEATSRSLKEVKQHQQTQNKIKNKNANKSLEQVLRHCFYKKGDSYHFEISSDDFEGNEQVLSFINKLDKFLNGKSDVELNEIHTKTKLFKMLTLVKGRWDPKEFSIYNMNDLLDGIHIKFFKMAKKSNIFNKTGYRFFHLSKNPNMKIINSTTETSHGGGAIYNQKTVFFYAVREDKLDDLFVKFIRQNKADNEKDKMFKVYGKYIYEYKPKRDDIFYTDNIDGLGERRTRDYLPESTPVFINTKNGLPVTRVDKNIVSRLLKSKKITPRKADFDVDGHIKQNPIYEYIDETIERFDAFMEEYQSTGCIPNEDYFQEDEINEYYYVESESGPLDMKSVKFDIEKLVNKSIIKNFKNNKKEQIVNPSKSISLEDFEKIIGVELSPELRKFINNPYDSVKENHKYITFDAWYTNFWKYQKILINFYTNYWSSKKFANVDRTKEFMLDLRKNIKLSDTAKRILGTTGVNELIPIGGLCLGFKECDDQIIYLHPSSEMLFSNIFMKTYKSKNEVAPICRVKDFEKLCESYVNGSYAVKIGSIMKHQNLGVYGFDDNDDWLEFKEMKIKSASSDLISLETLTMWDTIVRCEEYDCCPTTWIIDQHGSWMFDYLKRNGVIDQHHIDQLKTKFSNLDNLENYDWGSVFKELTNGDITMTLLDGYKELTKYFGYITMKINSKYFFVFMQHNNNCMITWSTNEDPSVIIFR